MTRKCDFCGNLIKRSPSQFNANGSRRNFCGMKCVSGYRSTQTGQASGRYKHGGKGTRLYKIWKGMKARCLNPKEPAFFYYGGQGISICKKWHNYIPFKDWALTHGYSNTLTIDRKNYNGNYTPRNCRWATRKQQSQNTSMFKRTPVMIRRVIKLKKDNKTTAEIAAITKMSDVTVRKIIRQAGVWQRQEVLS